MTSENLMKLQGLFRELFQLDKGLLLDGFMLTRTPLSEIVDAAGLSQAEIEKNYPLLWQEGDYIKKILTSK